MRSKKLGKIWMNITLSNKIRCFWEEEKEYLKVDGDMESQELTILIRMEHLFFTRIKIS